MNWDQIFSILALSSVCISTHSAHGARMERDQVDVVLPWRIYSNYMKSGFNLLWCGWRSQIVIIAMSVVYSFPPCHFMRYLKYSQIICTISIYGWSLYFSSWGLVVPWLPWRAERDCPLEPSESWWHLLRLNMQILGDVECGLDQEKWGGIICIIGQYRWI